MLFCCFFFLTLDRYIQRTSFAGSGMQSIRLHSIDAILGLSGSSDDSLQETSARTSQVRQEAQAVALDAEDIHKGQKFLSLLKSVNVLCRYI